MKAVTDPAILEQLNGAPNYNDPAVVASTTRDLYGEPQPVTDPAILAQLNGEPPVGNVEPLANDFVSRLSRDIEKRKELGQESTNAYAQGVQGLPETALQIFGRTGLGSLNDLAGQSLASLATMAPQSVKNAANYVAQSPVGVAGKEGLAQLGEAYSGFAQQNPRAARNIESVGNIFGSLPVGAAVVPASKTTGSALVKMGEVIGEHGVERATANKAKFVQDLITPHSTPTVRAEQFGRSKEQGLFRNRVVEPTPQEIEIMDTISTLPVSKNKSLLANYNIIENAKDAEAQSLMTALKQNDVVIDPVDVTATLDSSLESLKNSPFITGEAETSAKRVIEGMKEALKKNPSTASGLLQARKDFDAWVKAQKGKGVFDPQRDSAVTTAVQHVRQSINDLVEQRVPEIGFKDSLRKQSNMYRALDNIETKGGYEAANAVKRAAEKVADLIPVKSGLAKGSLAAVGLGGAIAAPAATGGALALYGVQKALRSPKTQESIGKAIEMAGRTLKLENPLRKKP